MAHTHFHFQEPENLCRGFANSDLQELVPGKRVYLTYEGAKKNNVNSAEKTCFKRISTSTTADNKPRTVVHLELPNVLDSLDIPKEIMVDLVDLWEWERIPLKQVYLADGTKVKVKKVSSTALRTSVDVELLEKREVTLNPEHIQAAGDTSGTTTRCVVVRLREFASSSIRFTSGILSCSRTSIEDHAAQCCKNLILAAFYVSRRGNNMPCRNKQFQLEMRSAAGGQRMHEVQC